MDSIFIGCDIGTSSVKTVGFDEDYNSKFRIAYSYDLISKNKDWAELDPDEVFKATLNSIKESLERSEAEDLKIEYISFSSALHSMIAVKTPLEPLSNCLTWADKRAKKLSRSLEGFYSRKDIYHKTGCPTHAMYMPAKILWFKKNRGEIFRQADKFISIKEYILKKLTGRFVVDYSIASGSGLLNIHRKEWEDEILDYLGIGRRQLSELVDGKKIVNFNDKYEEQFGNIPLVVGSGDGPLANLGELALNTGQYVATLGSSGAVRTFSTEPVLDNEDQRTWCYMLDDSLYLPGGAINNGGIVLDWLRKNFCQNDREDFLENVSNHIKNVPPGSKGIYFLPFLTGERSPNWNSYAKGIIFGLDYNHTFAEVVKAALEGISFRMCSIKESLEDLMGDCDEIIMNGGVMNSKPWIQLLADVFNIPVKVHENREASALGAVYLGAVALGYEERYSNITNDIDINYIKRPEESRSQRYNELYQFHKEIYQKNSELFKKSCNYN